MNAFLLSLSLIVPSADVNLHRCDFGKSITVNRGDVVRIELPGIGWKLAGGSRQLRPLPGVAPFYGMRWEAAEKGCMELRLEKVRGCCRGTNRSFSIKVEVK